MQDYRAILWRLSVALIFFGLTDIAEAIYRLVQGQSHAAYLGVYGIVAGISLLRHAWRDLGTITWFSALMLTLSICTVVIVWPVIQPAALWAIEFRLYPATLSIAVLLRLGAIAFLLWVYRQLQSTPVRLARKSQGQSVKPPYSAFMLGLMLVFVVIGATQLTLRGEAGQKAIELARADYGDRYNYHVTALSWEHNVTRASLKAYNMHEIKVIQVDWP